MDAAFAAMRRHARDHTLTLTAVATAVIDRTLDVWATRTT
jgi:AmiR/NasT family two-component response regulator